MPKLVWDSPGSRLYETGIDRCVLYPQGGNGVSWNGIVSITESPSGAEVAKQYADNRVYGSPLSNEEFGGTIEAFTYPDEFEECDGTVYIHDVAFRQQGRKLFGLSYRTRVGNDILGVDYGYKLHLVYNALAQPSEIAFESINDSPEASTFSWEYSTTPMLVPGYSPTALLTIQTPLITPTVLAQIEAILYGTSSTAARLPSPAEVIGLLENYSLVEDSSYPGTYSGSAFIEQSTYPGTYTIQGTTVHEDPSYPGTYLIGA